MKKRTTLLSLLFLNILFFSCSNLINNSAQGSLSIVMPGNNGRYSETDQTELPSTYNIKLTRNKDYTQEMTAQAGAILTIDKLVSGEYEIILSGSTTYYYFEGKANTIVRPSKDTTVTVKLTKFRKPLYIKSREVPSEIQLTGTKDKPFTTIEKALNFTADSENVAFYLDGIFNDFTVPAKASNLKKLYLIKAPDSNKVIFEAGNINIDSRIFDFKDIIFKDTDISVEGTGELRIGGDTKFEEFTHQPFIKLAKGKSVIITSPLTSPFVSNITLTTQTPGDVIIVPSSTSIDIAKEKARFKINDQPTFLNQFSISDSGKLVRNKELKIRLTSLEKGSTYSFEIKEKGSTDVISSAEYAGHDYTTIKKDNNTYCFTVGKTYKILVKKDGQPADQQEFTITENNGTVIQKDFSIRKTLSVSEAIAEMEKAPTKAHSLLVAINTKEDFKLLGTNISNKLTTGTTSIECVVASGITTIPTSSFANCGAKLTKIMLPEGITTIEENAFKDCGFTSVELPASVTTIGASAFENCTGITTINLSGNTALESIGADAFKGTGISELTVPDSVTTLGDTGITTLNIPCTLSIADNKTVTTLTVRSTTLNKAVTDSAYKNCTSLTSITLPDDLTGIGSAVFDGSGITSLKIPLTVTTLSDTLSGSGITTIIEAPCNLVFSKDTGTQDSNSIPIFEGNTNLTSVTLKKTATNTTVPDNAYRGCTALTSITLPDGLTGIGKNVFDGSGVTELSIPLTVTTLGDDLRGSSINTITTPCNLIFAQKSGKDYYGNPNLTNVTIKASTSPSVANKTKVVDSAFVKCRKLETVTLEGITEIGIQSFGWCYSDYPKSGLNNVTDKTSSLKILNKQAFSGCGLLTSFPFPNITTIGESGFSSSGITEINIPKLQTLGDHAFDGCNSVNKITNLGTITTIPQFTFYAGNPDATHFVDLTIPNTITEIGFQSFGRCKIDNLTIPASVKKISNDGFLGANITNLTIQGTNSWTAGSKTITLTNKNIINMDDKNKFQGDLTR